MLIELRRPAAPSPTDRSIPLFRLGFRPFFLGAGIFAALVIPFWLLVWSGHTTLPTTLLPAAWHAHEMVFGFVAAVIAGFLLTAVRNWTSLPTPSGAPLAALMALWVLGRVGLFLDGVLPHPLVALVDLAFLPAVAIAIARPIVSSKNWRNLAFVPLLVALTLANAAFHFVPTASLRATKVAIDVVLLIVVVIGGRVIPSFTANALRVDVKKRPWLDGAALGSLALLALVSGWFEGGPFASALAIVAGLLHALRLAGWGGWGSRRSPILWVLHLGYAWIALGLVLRGASGFFPTWIQSAATHGLAVGAIAILILGMMSRVSLGHTGRMLSVPRPIALAYVLLGLAAAIRTLGPLLVPTWYTVELVVAGTLWSLAFALFAFVYAPILGAARLDGKPG